MNKYYVSCGTNSQLTVDDSPELAAFNVVKQWIRNGSIGKQLTSLKFVIISEKGFDKHDDDVIMSLSSLISQMAFDSGEDDLYYEH